MGNPPNALAEAQIKQRENGSARNERTENIHANGSVVNDLFFLPYSQQTRPANCPIDGVGIVTILNKATGPELLLQKQYRPPIDKVAIEVPAGLIDAGETVEECAVRELREETGYVGEAEKTSSVMFNGMLSMFGLRISLACSWI